MVTAAIIEENGKYLITQRMDGFWEFPGGGVESYDASHEDCLEREISEELGIMVKANNLFLEFDYDYKDGPNIHLIGFNCDHIAGKIQHLSVQKHKWVYLNEIMNYVFLSADYNFIEKLRELPRINSFS